MAKICINYFAFFSFMRVLESVRFLMLINQRCARIVLFPIWCWEFWLFFYHIYTSLVKVFYLIEMRLTDQCPENISWPPVFSRSRSYCSLHGAGWRFGDCFHQIIEYVDTGFLVVEVATCSFIVFPQWWLTDKILPSVLNMVTYPIVEGDWKFVIPNNEDSWRGHAIKFLYMTVELQSLSYILQPSQSTLLQNWRFVFVSR
jgi:hypothetical protein